MKHEQLGHPLSFSKLYRWCYRCWGTCENPLHIGETRTREEHNDTAILLDHLSSSTKRGFLKLNHLAARKTYKKHTGIKEASAFYLALPNATPERFFKDVQHIFYEGEWQRHIHNLLFESDKYENHKLVEKRRVVTDGDLELLKKRLAISPIRKDQHHWIGLESIKSATSTQIKDLMEILSVILKGILARKTCDCRPISGSLLLVSAN